MVDSVKLHMLASTVWCLLLSVQDCGGGLVEPGLGAGGWSLNTLLPALSIFFYCGRVVLVL